MGYKDSDFPKSSGYKIWGYYRWYRLLRAPKKLTARSKYLRIPTIPLWLMSRAGWKQLEPKLIAAIEEEKQARETAAIEEERRARELEQHREQSPGTMIPFFHPFTEGLPSDDVLTADPSIGWN